MRATKVSGTSTAISLCAGSNSTMLIILSYSKPVSSVFPGVTPPLPPPGCLGGRGPPPLPLLPPDLRELEERTIINKNVIYFNTYFLYQLKFMKFIFISTNIKIWLLKSSYQITDNFL